MGALSCRTISSDWRIEDFDHVPPLCQQVYDTIRIHFDALNANNGFHRVFTDASFPPYKDIAAFIQAFFEHFQPLFPLIHQSTFDPRETPWILTLAVAVIGSRYSVLSANSSLTYLCEFLRRAVSLWDEQNLATDPSSQLCLAQARVLNQIGLMFSGDMDMTERAQMNMSHIAIPCKKASETSIRLSHRGSVAIAQYTSEDWERWILVESYRRLVYLSWLVDCQLALYFDLKPTISIHSLHSPMPSNPSLWSAATRGTWLSGLVLTPYPMSLHCLRQALRELYITKRTSSDCPEITRLLLTFGVFFDEQRELRAEVYLDALRRSEDQIRSTERLGWVVLKYNHTLSLLCYLPLRELLLFSGWRANNAERCEADVRLTHWVRKDVSTARLAIYHAAKVYSYIRGHPSCPYSETMAFLAATLAIWAVTMTLNHGVGPWRLTADSPLYRSGGLETLRLDQFADRPTILGWVSGKADLRPYLAGVGSLSNPDAIPLLIRESVHVLKTKLSCAFSDGVGSVLQSHFETKNCHQAVV